MRTKPETRWTVPGLLAVTALALPVPDKLEVFEGVRGTPLPSHGYSFTVSPDENWIAAIRLTSTPSGYDFTVLHRPTRRVWRFAAPDLDVLEILDIFPNCFSRDSKRIHLPGRGASLSADMAALQFQPEPDRPDQNRTFLNFPGWVKSRSGKTVPGWDSLPQNEGEYGEFAWSLDGRTLAESVTRGEAKSSALRLTPPGREARIDYAKLLSEYNANAKKGMGDLPAALRQAKPALTPEQEEALTWLLADLDESSAQIGLTDLSISPDGRFVAGVATITRGQSGFSGVPYGVVIPIDRANLVAVPFADNVYGKVLWSRDSSALYFYAQPTAGGGNGTVHRLPVTALALPARAPGRQVTPLSSRGGG